MFMVRLKVKYYLPGAMSTTTVLLPLPCSHNCSKAELMFVWVVWGVGWGLSKTSPQSLPWCSASFPVWTAPIPFWPKPSHPWCCPVSFPTAPSLLAAGAGSCSALQDPGSAHPEHQAWCSPPLLHSAQGQAALALQYCPIAASVVTVPSVLPFHLGTTSPCAHGPLQSHFSPSCCSSRVLLALIRPQGNGAGGKNDRNKDLSLGYVMLNSTQCFSCPRMVLNLPGRAQEQLWHCDVQQPVGHQLSVQSWLPRHGPWLCLLWVSSISQEQPAQALFRTECKPSAPFLPALTTSFIYTSEQDYLYLTANFPLFLLKSGFSLFSPVNGRSL